MGEIFIALNDFTSRIHEGRIKTLKGITMEEIVLNECTENISCKLTTNPIGFSPRLEAEENSSASAQAGMLRAASAAPSDTNNVRNVVEGRTENGVRHFNQGPGKSLKILLAWK